MKGSHHAALFAQAIVGLACNIRLLRDSLDARCPKARPSLFGHRHLAKHSLAYHQDLGPGLDSDHEVLHRQRVPLYSPPSAQDPVRGDDHVFAVGLAIHFDSPKAIVCYPGCRHISVFASRWYPYLSS